MPRNYSERGGTSTHRIIASRHCVDRLQSMSAYLLLFPVTDVFFLFGLLTPSQERAKLSGSRRSNNVRPCTHPGPACRHGERRPPLGGVDVAGMARRRVARPPDVGAPAIRLAADRLADAVTLAGYAAEVEAGGGHAPEYVARAAELAGVGHGLMQAVLEVRALAEHAWNPRRGLRVQVGRVLYAVAAVTDDSVWIDQGLVSHPGTTRARLPRRTWCALTEHGVLVAREAA